MLLLFMIPRPHMIYTLRLALIGTQFSEFSKERTNL